MHMASNKQQQLCLKSLSITSQHAYSVQKQPLEIQDFHKTLGQ